MLQRRALIDDKLLLVCILWVLLVFTLFSYHYLDVFKSDYFSFGPSDSLKFLDIPIDTWTKWTVLLSFRGASSVIQTAAGYIIAPWITTSIQADNVMTLPYPRWKCFLIVQLFQLYCGIMGLFSVFLLLTQVDVACVVLLCEAVILQVWILPRWMRGKQYNGTYHVYELQDREEN